MRKRRETVEVSLRIPAEGWRELTALLLALTGRDRSAAEDNPAFDMNAFRRSADAEENRERAQAEEAGAEHGQRYGDRGGSTAAEAPAADGATAVYGKREEPMRLQRREKPAEENGTLRETEETDWDLRWERDCRRYDGSFVLK